MAGLAALASPTSLFAAEGGWDTLFAVDTGLIIWTWATFLVLLFVLWRFAWKPLLGALEAREKRIRDSITEARQLREEAEESAAEHRRQLAEARREAQQIVADGREAGQKVRADIEEKARTEGAAMIERAKREIAQEKASALEELRKHSVELALSAASQLMGQKLDGEVDRGLVVEYLDKLQKDSQGAEA
ncbi:MAG: F0F1 ATP synthase subunit B [Acidimicrobiia bacterium]|nr:F0F1 ATP synthase subunit B [Acidimicrobiia bacterium]